MRRIYKNKSRNCPFSDDFLEGFNSGTEVQFEADVKVLEEIKAEIEDINEDNEGFWIVSEAIEIIDKYIKELK